MEFSRKSYSRMKTPYAGRISDGDCLELLFEGWRWVESETPLPLAHHVNHLDAGQCECCRPERFEAEQRAETPLDAAMILFEPVGEELAL